MDDQRSKDDRELDEALDESFPASDPPANTVETGVRPRPGPTPAVTNNTDRSQFEITIGNDTAFLSYERSAGSLVLVHTEVPASLRGQHIGDALVKAALDYGHQEHLRLVAMCPFVKAYLRKHPSIA